MADDSIIAAGAVIVRDSGTTREFLLIHRSYRDDWTFPKGKLDPGEHILSAAIREVREETGLAVVLSHSLPTQTYSVKGRTKHSFYWVARVIGGGFLPNNEVDEIRWCNYDQAKQLLTYPHDIDVLNGAAISKDTSPFIVLRHAQATKRAEWMQDKKRTSQTDADRPLTGVGRAQAVNIATALAAYGISQIFTSDARRCQDTVGVYAGLRGLPLHLEPAMSEEQYQRDSLAVHLRTTALMTTPDATVLCSHRPVLPTIMQSLLESFSDSQSHADKFKPTMSPGSFVVFHRDAAQLSQLVQVERHIR